jgi:hypothetical protein
MKIITHLAFAFVFTALLLSPIAASAQVKNINLQKGKKTVLKGQVRKGGERLYTFEAEKGQTLNVRLLSTQKKAIFSVNLQSREEYEIIEDNRTEWSGILPESESGIYSIAVKSNKGLQVFTLEITLK